MIESVVPGNNSHPLKRTLDSEAWGSFLVGEHIAGQDGGVETLHHALNPQTLPCFCLAIPELDFFFFSLKNFFFFF